MQELKLKFNRRPFWLSGFCIILMLIFSTSIKASSKISSHQMKLLQKVGKTSLSQLSSKAKVVVIYQPECHWCKKQIADLVQLQHQCRGSFDTVLVGARSNQFKLKSELRYFEGDFPALLANRQFLRDIGGVKATPVSLFFNEKNVLIGKKQGYLPEEQMRKIVDLQTNQTCS